MSDYILMLINQELPNDKTEHSWNLWDVSDIFEPWPGFVFNDWVVHSQGKSGLYLIGTPYLTLEDIKEDFLFQWTEIRGDTGEEALERFREFHIDDSDLRPPERRALSDYPYTLERGWQQVDKKWFRSKRDGSYLPRDEGPAGATRKGRRQQ